MFILTCEQRSDEWYKARSGKPTASGFSNVITTKGEPSKSRTKYMYKLAGERISGVSEESYQSAAMSRGNELEAEARNYYEFFTGTTVDQVGFCSSDCSRYGCSPDGLIGEDGGLQIKCPSLAVHVEYLLGKGMPMDYFQQVQGELFVTGRQWWDFLSYYPGLKPFLVRVTPDLDFHSRLGFELNSFCGELEQIILRIK